MLMTDRIQELVRKYEFLDELQYTKVHTDNGVIYEAKYAAVIMRNEDKEELYKELVGSLEAYNDLYNRKGDVKDEIIELYRRIRGSCPLKAITIDGEDVVFVVTIVENDSGRDIMTQWGFDEPEIIPYDMFRKKYNLV